MHVKERECMLNRNDMLELTRRMNPSRCCFSRMAGGYRDEEGYDNGTFNIHFLKLTAAEKVKNIAIAKAIPFAETNVELKEFELRNDVKEQRDFRMMLNGLKSCELKNDALLETFYDVVTEKYLPKHKGGDFAVYVFYGAYDIKAKAADKEYLDDSEEVYSFIICAICPVSGDYEAGEPACGFLYPSFKDRSADPEHIAVYKAAR